MTIADAASTQNGWERQKHRETQPQTPFSICGKFRSHSATVTKLFAPLDNFI